MPDVLVSAALLLLLIVPAPLAAQTDDAPREAGGTDILGVFGDSVKLLLIEHATRVMTQESTRRELSGPFWTDYRRSVRVPPRWHDADPWFTNYIGHPIHGAAAGYLWMDRDPRAPAELSLSGTYWWSRTRATLWSVAYSAQFEFGPLSEASIGNVGLRPETSGWVDHVVTPVGALALIVAEDALDRYFVKWVEQRTTNRVWRASLRMLFNPSRALANVATQRTPWDRRDRPIGWRHASSSVSDFDR
jgi:hypothetical protein